MTFSHTVAQQRAKQEKYVRRFVGYSLVGSFLLHGIAMGMRVSRFENPPAAEDLVVVVEPPTEPIPVPSPIQSETVQPEQVEREQPLASRSVDAPGASRDAELVEPPTVPQRSPDAPPSPSELPSASPQTPAAEPTGTADAEDENPAPGPLRSFFPTSSGSPEGAGTVAAAPGTTGAGDRPVANPESDSGEGSRSRGGSQSREITCRGCDFDYPDQANGAEGTARVVVETDASGRVVSVMLSRSSGNAELDQAALRQARERVRLNNARAGESYPLDIEFVQPGSRSASQARQRGDRRSITVTDPAPAADTPSAPATATQQPPTPTPSPSSQPSTAAPAAATSPSPAALPNASPTEPSSSPASVQAEPTPASSPAPTPASVPSRPASPAPARSPSATPAARPSATPRPAPAARPSAPAERPRPAIERNNAPIVDVRPEAPARPRFRPLPRRTPRPTPAAPVAPTTPPPAADSPE
ncbi:TonB family protein [Leptolyngbya sp. O-77]|uniref:TonB family protein n=1 Tax=Leptolyngbya sp. O-77 TaxID=1080068 RepID=UPI00074D42FD|nr:TonB family protein [Leptolyngbya sp. O-77]BAU40267.1 Gram-negative bacterial tonB protein [Leptolyngbya sp. O-77]